MTGLWYIRSYFNLKYIFQNILSQFINTLIPNINQLHGLFLSFQMLNNRGNFQYNVRVLQGLISPDAQIIPRRRSVKHVYRNEDYLPCPICQGFVLKCELWRHHTRCMDMDDDPDKENERDYKVAITAEAKILLSAAILSKKKDLNNFVSISFFFVTGWIYIYNSYKIKFSDKFTCMFLF